MIRTELRKISMIALASSARTSRILIFESLAIREEIRCLFSRYNTVYRDHRTSAKWLPVPDCHRPLLAGRVLERPVPGSKGCRSNREFNTLDLDLSANSQSRST